MFYTGGMINGNDKKSFKVCVVICASLMEYQQLYEIEVMPILNVFVCELNMVYNNFDEYKFEKYIKSLIH